MMILIMTTATCLSKNAIFLLNFFGKSFTEPIKKAGKNSFFSGFFILLFFLLSLPAMASQVLIPMDAETQRNHLKAYGITYWMLEKEVKVQWLLNYRGGSFLLPDSEELRRECQIRGVSFEVISDQKTEEILEEISSPAKNM
ncbi:MAG: hypothetical protein R3209_10230, partial [Salinimicrobium sediminis]|nr:hypothetical protein [Salinimicrobium sediminis]